MTDGKGTVLYLKLSRQSLRDQHGVGKIDWY